MPDSHEFKAAAEVARQVASLYERLHSLAFSYGLDETNADSRKRIEREISELRAEAESCQRLVAACDSVLGVIYHEFRKQRADYHLRQ